MSSRTCEGMRYTLDGLVMDRMSKLHCEASTTATRTSNQAAHRSGLSLCSTHVQVQALKKDRAVLETNISSLFKTAQLELERKNKEIVSLRQAARLR